MLRFIGPFLLLLTGCHQAKYKGLTPSDIAGLVDEPGLTWEGAVERFPGPSDLFLKSTGLDFNASGFVTAQVTTLDDTIRAMTYLPDGRLVAAGRQFNGTFNHYLIARIWPDGDFDSSFSNDGVEITVFPEGESLAHAITTDNQGRYIVVGRRWGFSQFDFGVSRYLTNGNVDTTFSSDGHLLVDFGGADFGRAVSVDGAGRIIAVGYSNCCTSQWDFAIARVNSNGTLDSSFDTDGKVTTSLNGNANEWFTAYAVLVDDQDRIVVGGRRRTAAARNDVAVARYLTNGSLDTIDFTASSPGYRIRNFTSDDIVWGMAFNTEDNIMVVGRRRGTGQFDLMYHRIGSNGSGRGATTVVLSSGAVNRAAVQDSAGRILAASMVYDGTDWNYALTRYTGGGGGSLDTSFATGGTAITAMSTLHDQTRAIAYDGGKIAIGGRVIVDGTDYDLGIVRFNSDGSTAASGDLDLNFSTDGFLVETAGSGLERYMDLTVDPQGRLVAAARIESTGQSHNISLTRFTLGGELDTTFGTNGRTSTDYSNADDRAHDVAVETTIGRLVVAARASPSGDQDMAIVRYLSDGTLDTSFDTDGRVAFDLAGNNDVARAIEIDNMGRYVIGGFANMGASGNDFAMARVLTSGALDTTFSTDGILTVALSNNDDRAFGLVIQSDGKLLLAGRAQIAGSGNANNDYAVIRVRTDGTLDSTFNSDGIVSVDFSGTRDDGYDVALDPDENIVLSGQANNDFGLARLTTNGTLDTQFSTDGRATLNINGTDVGRRLEAQPNGKILMTGWSNPGGGVNQFIVARFESDGRLDSDFSSDGYAAVNLTTTDDESQAIALMPDGRIVIAGEATTAGADLAIARFWP